MSHRADANEVSGFRPMEVVTIVYEPSMGPAVPCERVVFMGEVSGKGHRPQMHRHEWEMLYKTTLN